MFEGFWGKVGDFCYELGLFGSKAFIIIVLVILVLVILLRIAKGMSKMAAFESPNADEPKIYVRNLKEEYDEDSVAIADAVITEEERKEEKKKQKQKEKEAKKAAKEEKASKKAESKIEENKKEDSKVESKDESNGSSQNESKNSESQEQGKSTLFVIDFDGSTDAREVNCLRKSITAILKIAEKTDEVLIRLTSPGGTVNGYGLGASQLQRLRDKEIPVTVAVDEVAASGGYLMASVANKIIAAPFAYIGSIGVVAEFPNFNRLLKKYDIDYEQVTAGEFKRTLTTMGENTEEARKKFKEELELVHKQFKAHVQSYRPNVDIENIAKGECWLAKEALELGLIDELGTSDTYIDDQIEKRDAVLLISYKVCKKRFSIRDLRSSLVKFAISVLGNIDSKPKY